MSSERRLHVRKLIDARVRIYHSLLGTRDGRIRDISEAGCCVTLDGMQDIEDSLFEEVKNLEEEFVTLRPVNMDVVFRMSCVRNLNNGLVLCFEDCEEGSISADAL